MKAIEQRKQSMREINSRKLSSELLARTMGVFMKRKKTAATPPVTQAPHTEIAVRVTPMLSPNDRNSICLGTQASLRSLDQ